MTRAEWIGATGQQLAIHLSRVEWMAGSIATMKDFQELVCASPSLGRAFLQ